MSKKTYRVLRQLDGDKQYLPGDTRELSPADAKHLVDLGALVEIDGAAADYDEGQEDEGAGEKAQPPVENKAEAPVENKAEVPAASRAKPAKASTKPIENKN